MDRMHTAEAVSQEMLPLAEGISVPQGQPLTVEMSFRDEQGQRHIRYLETDAKPFSVDPKDRMVVVFHDKWKSPMLMTAENLVSANALDVQRGPVLEAQTLADVYAIRLRQYYEVYMSLAAKMHILEMQKTRNMGPKHTLGKDEKHDRILAAQRDTYFQTESTKIGIARFVDKLAATGTTRFKRDQIRKIAERFISFHSADVPLLIASRFAESDQRALLQSPEMGEVFARKTTELLRAIEEECQPKAPSASASQPDQAPATLPPTGLLAKIRSLFGGGR